jgi:hypothetical protein
MAQLLERYIGLLGNQLTNQRFVRRWPRDLQDRAPIAGLGPKAGGRGELR